MRSSNRARKALTASNRHWGYMSIRAVRQTPYKKYNGTAPTERTDTVIPYRIEHVYVLESGFNFWPCTCTSCTSCNYIASFSACAHHAYCVTFDTHEELCGEPVEFYHESDVKGRETVLSKEDSLNVGGLTAALHLAHVR